jgi:hypothetical protein
VYARSAGGCHVFLRVLPAQNRLAASRPHVLELANQDTAVKRRSAQIGRFTDCCSAFIAHRFRKKREAICTGFEGKGPSVQPDIETRAYISHKHRGESKIWKNAPKNGHRNAFKIGHIVSKWAEERV